MAHCIDFRSCSSEFQSRPLGTLFFARISALNLVKSYFMETAFDKRSPSPDHDDDHVLPLKDERFLPIIHLFSATASRYNFTAGLSAKVEELVDVNHKAYDGLAWHFGEFGTKDKYHGESRVSHSSQLVVS